MKIAKRSADDGGEFRSGPSTGITAANYRDRAVAFIRGSGGSGFVIRAFEGINGALASRESATEAQWIAWMSYFAAKQIPCTFALANGMTTVPSEWPEDFDVDAETSGRNRLLPAPKTRVTPERRQIIAAKLTALARKYRDTKPRPSSTFEPEAKPDDLYRYRDAPVAPLSFLAKIDGAA